MLWIFFLWYFSSNHILIDLHRSILTELPFNLVKIVLISLTLGCFTMTFFCIGIRWKCSQQFCFVMLCFVVFCCVFWTQWRWQISLELLFEFRDFWPVKVKPVVVQVSKRAERKLFSIASEIMPCYFWIVHSSITRRCQKNKRDGRNSEIHSWTRYWTN